jgi:hypothetical protein
MQSDRPDVAAQLLNDRATALENSGGNPQEIASTRAMAEWATTHPDTFKLSSGVMLARHHGPGQVRGGVQGHHRSADRRRKKRPAKVAEAGAKASEAITTAQNAPGKQAAEIAKTGHRFGQRRPAACARSRQADDATRRPSCAS